MTHVILSLMSNLVAPLTWKLYKGPNGSTTVFSFVAESNQYNFSGDLYNFLSYLVSYEGLLNSQYLKSIGAGTEPFTGKSSLGHISCLGANVNHPRQAPIQYSASRPTISPLTRPLSCQTTVLGSSI
jgi:hypothetical protein